jgi:hypothetical protein
MLLLDNVPIKSRLSVSQWQKCQKQHVDKNWFVALQKLANDINDWYHLSGFFMLSSVILKDLESTLIGMSAWGLMNLIVKVLFKKGLNGMTQSRLNGIRLLAGMK